MLTLDEGFFVTMWLVLRMLSVVLVLGVCVLHLWLILMSIVLLVLIVVVGCFSLAVEVSPYLLTRLVVG